MGRLSDREPISIAPGGPYADLGTPMVHEPSRGGWYPAQDDSAGSAGHSDRDADGARNSGLRRAT
jgi:hypothetical protein